MKRLLVLSPLLLLTLASPASAGGGCATGGPASIAAATTVKIEHACFFPAAARVATGATVTFLNDSGLDHNISGPGIDFVDLPNGAKHTQRFATAGLYPFACTIHPGMSGVLVVGDVGLPQAAPVVNPPAESAAAVPVSKTTPDDGGTDVLPWVVGGVMVAVASGIVVTFARREGRLPVPTP